MKRKYVGPISRGWWDLAYEGVEHIEPVYEYAHNRDTLLPGTPIRIKNQRGIYLFRCVAENTRTGSKWIDCLGPEKQWHSFTMDRIKGAVKPKKFRRKVSK